MDEYQDAASRIVAVLGEPGAREFPTLLEYTNTVRAEHSGNSTDEATATNVTGGDRAASLAPRSYAHDPQVLARADRIGRRLSQLS